MELILAKRLRTLDFDALKEYANAELDSIKKELLNHQGEILTAAWRGKAEAMKELLRLGDLVDRTLKDFTQKT